MCFSPPRPYACRWLPTTVCLLVRGGGNVSLAGAAGTDGPAAGPKTRAWCFCSRKASKPLWSAKISPWFAVRRAQRVGGKKQRRLPVGGCGSEPPCPQAGAAGRAGQRCAPGNGVSLHLPPLTLWTGGTLYQPQPGSRQLLAFPCHGRADVSGWRIKGEALILLLPPTITKQGSTVALRVPRPRSIPRAGGTSPVLPHGPPVP